ncbi:DUF4190 domain-containing protein [Nocardioides taihuensis]|uniref:DUF4190 domain-containing protein n=1 Tax=Nocardioides taihuensis TaxID=1835606 RepID=A0ABW0BPX4_9ACTN
MSNQAPPPPPPPGGGSYGTPPPPGDGGQPPYGGPPPPSYGGQPGYGAPSAGNNSKAVWALVLGILGLLCCSPLGIVAIILGRSAQSEIATSGQGGAGMAKAGFILGIIALVFLVLQIIGFATGVIDFSGDVNTSG